MTKVDFLALLYYDYQKPLPLHGMCGTIRKRFHFILVIKPGEARESLTSLTSCKVLWMVTPLRLQVMAIYEFYTKSCLI